jgi:hypothetical protein
MGIPCRVHVNSSLQKGGIGFVNRTLVANLEGSQEKVVFRVFISGQFTELLDKKRERVITLLLNELDISPPVLCMFANGFCFQFIDGQQFHWKDFSEFDDIRIAK